MTLEVCFNSCVPTSQWKSGQIKSSNMFSPSTSRFAIYREELTGQIRQTFFFLQNGLFRWHTDLAEHLAGTAEVRPSGRPKLSRQARILWADCKRWSQGFLKNLIYPKSIQKLEFSVLIHQLNISDIENSETLRFLVGSTEIWRSISPSCLSHRLIKSWAS